MPTTTDTSRAAGAIADTIYDIPVRDASGRTRTLGEYRGEVLLIVNTASY